MVEQSDGYGQTTVFALNTRIGRLRLLTRMGFAFILLYLAAVIVSLTIAFIASVSIYTYVLLAVYSLTLVVFIIFNIMFFVQRLHDLNLSGWLSVLLLIPVVNLLLILFLVFAPGTQGSNNHGVPPPPNTLTIKILGVFFLIAGLVVILLFAFIVVPSYQKRAEMIQGPTSIQPQPNNNN